jgi:hypothetical protein
MYHLLHLHHDEALQRRVTDAAQPLIGPTPRGPKPDLAAAQRRPSPKPRARRHTPVADALAAWRAYVTRRHAKREPVAWQGDLHSLGDQELLNQLSALHGDVPRASGEVRNRLWGEALELHDELQRRYPPSTGPLRPSPTPSPTYLHSGG